MKAPLSIFSILSSEASSYNRGMSFPQQNAEIEKIVHETMSQGWSYTPHLFTSSQVKNINDFFDSHRGDFTEAKVGMKNERKRDVSIRSDSTLWLDPLSPPEELTDVFEFLNALRTELNQKLYLGLREYETHLSLYPPGTFYKTHRDCFQKDSSRVISFILYLNPHWIPGDGGELKFYDQEMNVISSFAPSEGSFVCFLSADFPHEVLPGKKERRSLTGWIHRKNLN